MYINALIKKFRKKKPLLFTTPGHIQGFHSRAEFAENFGGRLFQGDFAEIDGMDNLQNPSGAILKSLQKTAEIYGTKASFYLINGSSSGIIAMILATVKRGEKILLARNVHKSVVNALILSGAMPVWLETEWEENWHIPSCANPLKIAQKLDENPDIKALLITSPTYEGIASDIKAVSEICRKKNIIFLVDEAHGALWNFSDLLPVSSMRLGADACVQSLHKTGSCLNQGAILHLCPHSRLDPQEIQQVLNIINTTSPSYILLSSIEASVNHLNSQKGREKLNHLIENIEKTKKRLKEHTNAVFLENADCFLHDPTKIFFGLKDVSGEDLSDFLQDKHNIEVEMVNDKGVLALAGIGSEKKHLEKLTNSVIKANKKLQKNYKEKNITPFVLPQTAFTPSEAFCREFERININQALGEISHETIVKYPPGIPLIISGEIIKQEHINILKDRQEIKVVKKYTLK
ncbi:MAG TPA: aminotransferase class I/II-fold pyridoxal phosphate-dependent enzyme [Candidatus Gastranaerophilales bacterium]|nr:aminotransferase class I/II-fold pyridoxal phosphate-dependent enzyme [Candidatus Gastranaerophilales bacterium]